MMGLRASGLAAQDFVLPLPARDRSTGTTTGAFTRQPITCSIGANPSRAPGVQLQESGTTLHFAVRRGN